MSRKVFQFYILVVASLILAACQSTVSTETPEPIIETMVVTEIVEATPVEFKKTRPLRLSAPWSSAWELNQIRYIRTVVT